MGSERQASFLGSCPLPWTLLKGTQGSLGRGEPRPLGFCSVALLTRDRDGPCSHFPKWERGGVSVLGLASSQLRCSRESDGCVRAQRRAGGSRSPLEAAGAVGSVESPGLQPSLQASAPLLAEIRHLGWLPQAGREPQVSWFPACCLDLAFMEAYPELLASEGEELGEGEGKAEWGQETGLSAFGHFEVD